MFEGDLKEDVAPNTKEMINEAVLCFFGSSYRGVVAFCRSALEEALEAKNVKGDDLFKKIEAAKKGELLGDVEVSQAHGARLVGREALHRMGIVSQAQGMLALAATVDLLNHITKQKPLPALQSKKDSNES